MLKRIYFKYIPWAVLIVALISTFLFAYRYYVLAQRDREARFNAFAAEVKTAIHDRLYDYMDGLYSGVALFDASEYVSRSEWQNFVSSIRLSKRFPGILGMGYIEKVPHQNLAEFIHKIKTEGETDFSVRPPGVRPYYFLVKYLEPRSLNKNRVGFDMNMDDVRHAALVASRDKGRPALTTPLFLEDEKKQSPGFLLLVPLYRHASSLTRIPATIAEREMNIQGWVFGRFVAKEFFEGILQGELAHLAPNIYLTVQVENKKGKPEFLFNNSKIIPSQYLEKKITKNVDIDFFGTRWMVKVQTTPLFFEGTKILDPIWILIIGILLSLLLFAFVYMLSYTHRHALRLANTMTNDLHEKVMDLNQSNEELHELIYTASSDFKKPLQNIYKLLEQIESDIAGNLSPETQQEMELLKARLAHWRESLDKLVEYSRVRSLAKILKIEKVDIKQLVQLVFVELDNPHRVELILSEVKFPIIKTHTILLQSVLEQLMKNALQYSQEKGGKLYVSAVEDAGFVIFELKDNGMGMSEARIAQLFSFYKQELVEVSKESMPMGLMIAKKIVDTYGGVIKIITNELGGVSCYFTWPIETDLSNLP